MDKVRLLIIDEHEAVREALAARLSSAASIEVVATAQDMLAPEFFCSGYSDVALLGLKSSSSNMDLDATIDSVACLTQAGTAVIILTSYADDIERELVLHAGAYRYLLKDINSPQLISEIIEVANEQARPVA
jgi:two-component system NarL family response regulator